jgi:hypothetical protein
MATCRGCGQQIHFVATPAGKQMPVDPAPIAVTVPEGTVANLNGQALVFNGVQTVTGYRPHWASCPAAGAFKRLGRMRDARKERE